MAKHRFTFRAYAVDETDHWCLDDTILAGVPAFGVYLILEDEATHICSFERSSRAEFLHNVFLTETEEQHEEAGDLIHESGGEWTSYFGFVDCQAKAKRPYLSERHHFTLDSRDYDLDPEEYQEHRQRALRWESPQKAAATARYNCLREYAWEVAREWMSCNQPSIPVIDDPDAYEAHRRRKVLAEAKHAEWQARHYGNRTLFDHAGIEAPLALAPN